MPFTTVTVTATILEPDNATPAKGHIEFQLTNDMADGSGGRILARTRQRVKLDSNGQIEVDLAATDDVTTSPQGTLYLVTENIVGAPTRTYHIEVPAADPTLDLATISPTAPGAVYVAGPEGPQGDMGPEGPQGIPGPVISIDGQTGAALVSPTATEGISHLASGGADVNNGLSWGKAKLTVASALTGGARYVALGKANFVVPAAITLPAPDPLLGETSRTVLLAGVGADESVLNASGLSGTVDAFNTDPGGTRGSVLRDFTFLGPGIGSSVTALKPYSGTSMRNVRVANFGVGASIRTRNGVYFDASNEFHGCGVGVRTAIDGNQNQFSARFLFCGIGIESGSNLTNAAGAWFELCTGPAMKSVGGSLMLARAVWAENNITQPLFEIRPTSGGYPHPSNTIIAESMIRQNDSATHAIIASQGCGLSIVDTCFGNANYAAMKVEKWFAGLYTRGILAPGADGGATDKNRRGHFRVELEPGAKYYELRSRDDLIVRPLDVVAPASGGIAQVTHTDLLGGIGFSGAMSGGVLGSTTVLAGSDGHLPAGCPSLKFTFAAGTSGSGHLGRWEHSFSAVEGQLYTIVFSAKANINFRAMALRMWSMASGGFESFPIDYFDLETDYNGNRYFFVWKAPTTASYRIGFYPSAATTNAVAIEMTVSNPVVWAGSVPGVYVPGRAAQVAEGTLAAHRIDLGADTNLFRSAADVIATDDDILVRSAAAGQVAIGNRGPASQAGITFGSAADTNLYRSAANTLRTDDTLFVNAGFNTGDDSFVRVGLTAEVAIGARGPSSQACITFGQARDTNLYRSAADVLKTDDAFRTGSSVTGSRPSASAVGVGAQWYDTTLTKPIWSDGTNWRDAAGTIV